MLRKALAILGILLTLPILRWGVKYLAMWARAGHGYAVRFDYGSEAGVWLIWGGLTVLFLLGALRSKKGGAVFLLVGWVSLLLVAIALPSRHIDPMERAHTISGLELIHVQTGLDAWGKEHGRFPSSQAELEEAFQLAEEAKAAAPFVQDGKVLPYRPLYVGGAHGPARAVPAGAPPGTILCAVNPELNHYWLTVTGLAEPFGAVVIERNPTFEEPGSGLREGSLAPPPPPPPAKKRK